MFGLKSWNFLDRYLVVESSSQFFNNSLCVWHENTDYTYISKTIVSDNIPKPPPSKGCSCKGKCTDEKKCDCARKNGGSFPYVLNNGGR